MARKMKDSGIEWIKSIPENWTCKRGKQLFVETNERSTDGTEELLTVSHITGVTPRRQKNVNMFMSESLTGYKICHPGDIAANTMWMWQGAVGVSNYHGVISPSYNTYRHRTNDYDSKYLDYLLRIQPLIDTYAAYSTGITLSRLRLYPESFLSIYFIVPPLTEQQQISNYLDVHCSEIDDMLSKTRSSIEEYKKLKQAVITQAVTKGVRGEREMRNSGVDWIGNIPQNWIVGKLKYYWISVESGVSVNAADRPIDNFTQYGVLKTSSVSKFVFNPQEHKQVNNDEYSRVSCPVTADCIIVSRMNTPDLVGACGYVEKDYPNLFLPDRLWQISFKNDISAKFIWYYLNNKMVRSYISSLSTGTSSTMQNISQGQFGNIFVCIPDSTEQKEIADYLDVKCAEIDKLIAKKEQLVKELEVYKKSLIYEVVTGKREV